MILVEVAHDLFDAQGGQYDAKDDRKVEVRVSVGGELGACDTVDAFEQMLGIVGDPLEVGPPERRGQADREEGADHDGGGDRVERDSDADRDDRFSKCENHDEAVMFGEMRDGLQAPRTADVRGDVDREQNDNDRDSPNDEPPLLVDQCTHDQQNDGRQCRCAEGSGSTCRRSATVSSPAAMRYAPTGAPA